MKVELYQTAQLDHYTEGPAMDSEGNLYCTTLSGGKILKMGTDGHFSVWGHSICPNGQIILPDGDHLVCDSRQASIVRYNKDGDFRCYEIFQKCEDQKIAVPNDLVVDQGGGIYFTDSIRKEGKVGYRSVSGMELILATELDYPNGLELSADEKTLFVAESYRNRIIAIQLKSPGVAKSRAELFANLPFHISGNSASNLPDGIALDSQHRLWVAHYGMNAVQVIDLNGEIIQTIEMQFPLVSNVLISESGAELVVTGGYSEPGPGVVCRFRIE